MFRDLFARGFALLPPFRFERGIRTRRHCLIDDTSDHRICVRQGTIFQKRGLCSFVQAMSVHHCAMSVMLRPCCNILACNHVSIELWSIPARYQLHAQNRDEEWYEHSNANMLELVSGCSAL